MLKSIKLQNVGPAASMELDFGPRLNILTGDNGLGKTFALDLVWFALTEDWAGEFARPYRREAESQPKIDVRVQNGDDVVVNDYVFVAQKYSWIQALDRDNMDNSIRQLTNFLGGIQHARTDSLVVYQTIDNDFHCFDGTYDLDTGDPSSRISGNRQSAMTFKSKEVWRGDTVDNGESRIKGLIDDWDTWQYRKQELFDYLQEALRLLSPPDMMLEIGKPQRISPTDRTEYPTINLRYDRVAITLLSAGMKRIISLAYMLIWLWSEHVALAELLGINRKKSITFIIDEIESHLHPQWQRVILPAIMKVVELLDPEIKVQLFVTTHAPLVLASVEGSFDDDIDNVLHFQMDKDTGKVSVGELPWASYGEVDNWLTSPVFDLNEARSKEAEEVIAEANAYMRGDSLNGHSLSKEEIQQKLERILPSHDEFWFRWVGSKP